MLSEAVKLAVRSKSCHMLGPPLGSVCGEEKDLAADAFLPLLNQLISQGRCQEGVRSGGLWGAPDLGAAMPNARDSGLSKPPEEKGGKHSPCSCKNNVTPCDKTPAKRRELMSASRVALFFSPPNLSVSKFYTSLKGT